MSWASQIVDLLAKKPSWEWVAPDLFVEAPNEVVIVLEETIAPVIPEPVSQNAWQHLTSDNINVNSLIIPTAIGLVVTSFGLILLKRIFKTSAAASRRSKDKSTELANEYSIKSQFRNQNERTISMVDQLVSRATHKVPEVAIFFTSEDTKVTAVKLCVRLLQLIFLAQGDEKEFRDIEMEHVVSGKCYNRYAVSWHFLRELRSTLSQKTGIIITEYEEVHPYSAALLTFQTDDLLDVSQGAYLFLIVNTESFQDELPTSPESAMERWLENKLGPYFRPEVLEGIQKQLGEKSCVVQKEPLSALMSL